MGRALTGSVVVRPGGRFQASIRIAPGNPARHYELFDTKAQATAWCALAASNVAEGLPLPSRDVVLGKEDPSRSARPKSGFARPLPGAIAPVFRVSNPVSRPSELCGSRGAPPHPTSEWGMPLNSPGCEMPFCATVPRVLLRMFRRCERMPLQRQP